MSSILPQFQLRALFTVFLFVPQLAWATVDGKVHDLNEETFRTLQAIRRRNPNSTLTESEARELKAAILKDQELDDAERDLLEEMTQSQFRGITVFLADDESNRVVAYPTSANAKRVLQDTLDPPLDLEAAWQQGNEGWNNLVRYRAKTSVSEARTEAFVQARLAEAWDQSNMGNAYKPLRDLISLLYGYTGLPGADLNSGRTLLYRTLKALDSERQDKVPDFLYNWVRPGGYLH